MQPPTIDFSKLNNIERTIRSNQDNMTHIAPRVNLNIGTSSRTNSFITVYATSRYNGCFSFIYD